MNQTGLIVFVCEHGAAKSVLAAVYFNKFASEMGLDLRAVARGTNPADELSAQTLRGLSQDGLGPVESVPQKLTDADIHSAARVITFCKLPLEYGEQAIIEHWEGVPPVGEDYEKARDAMIERIRQMINR